MSFMPMIHTKLINLTKYKTISITRKHKDKYKHKHKLSPINQNHKLHFSHKPKTHCTIFYKPKKLQST